MKMSPVIGMVLALSVSFTLLAGSGIGAAVFGENPGDARVANTVGDIGEDASVDEDKEGGGLSADVAGDKEPTLVGFALSSVGFLTKMVAAVALLPFTLMNLGFPGYFALPVGSLAQIITFAGLGRAASGASPL